MSIQSDGVVSLGDTTREQLPRIHAMEQGHNTAGFIVPYSIEKHRREFDRDSVFYKSVYDAHGEHVGFVILVLDADGTSLEFRRVVISRKGQGFGKRVVALIDAVAAVEFGCRRLWLAVFADILIGRHIYEAGGYTQIAEEELRGRPLCIYEKAVAPSTKGPAPGKATHRA